MTSNAAGAPSAADGLEPTAAPEPWVSVRNLNKTFGTSRVLHDVDFDVYPGEIHALVGQNGSGKSTLIKVLSGVHSADPGSVVRVAGTPLSNPVPPQELKRYGLAFVHQDLGLVDECSVLENIRLGQFSVRHFSRRIEWRAERRAAERTLARLHSAIDPSHLVGSLQPGDKALVAVGRALQSLLDGAGCVVFDESTRALPREVLPDFYATVKRLAATGTAIVIVSHRLDEVLALSDRVTVLQDGRVVTGGRPTRELTESTLAQLLLGRELELLEEREGPTHSSPHETGGLSGRGLSSKVLRSVDFHMAPGEIVGVTGATGSGHNDLPYVLAAARPSCTGTVEIADRVFDLSTATPGQLIEAGVALVPEDRAHEGLALELTAQENLTLPRTTRRGRIMLRSTWQVGEFADAVEMLGIAPANRHLPCSAFSGGNQQKILLAKWLLNRPTVMLLHEPTQAVDVGARMDILRAIRSAAARGISVLISSTEPQDLAAVCDRVVVLRSGVLTAELVSDISADAITDAIYPSPAGVGQAAGDSGPGEAS